MSSSKKQKTEASGGGAGSSKAASLATLTVDGKEYRYYSLPKLSADVARLPYSIRVVLESALRNGYEQHVASILDWKRACAAADGVEIQFNVSRVILQDFTGVPSVVDLAAMRDAVARLGGDARRVTPAVPVDLVIDHSVQVDSFGRADSLARNLEREFERNAERFRFLKWGANALDTLQCLPPGMGIVHQVNIEYLARVVFERDGLLYFDTLVGTDSHTPMVNGLGVLGWGVGGIEAEAAMLNRPISIVLPKVVGVKLTGRLGAGVTATDLVLAVVRTLRAHGVVEKFVEFYGAGVASLTVADRATISNMAPEYGATCGFFPFDAQTMAYLRLTGRSDAACARIEAYLRAQGMFRDYADASQDPEYSEHVAIALDAIVPAVSGPKRPEDFVALADLKASFTRGLTASPVGFSSYALDEALAQKAPIDFEYEGSTYKLSHGSVVIAAITSCTNTSNPSVLMAAGLLAKKAAAAGLRVAPYVKTSLAPGSGVVTEYLKRAALDVELEKLGFYTVGYGCTTCIGNSGPLPKEVAAVVEREQLVVCGVLSGNRNFEGRIHPHVAANYLASPPLVVLFALAGRVDIDFATEPVGVGAGGAPVYLRDLWPTNAEVADYVARYVERSMFERVYATITRGTEQWNALDAGDADAALYPWDAVSTYIHKPPFFATMTRDVQPVRDIERAYCLGYFGDSITTDHISPAGAISRKSPAARYLAARGVDVRDFNSYGSRRGNDEIMARGTFANIRLRNLLNANGAAGPKTLHVPSGELMDVFDAAERYRAEGQAPSGLVIIAGANYGSGSSRDWAAKGVAMQGVRAVIAQSFERIHRSNLVLFGIAPLQFLPGESAATHALTGRERFTLRFAGGRVQPGQTLRVDYERADGSTGAFDARLRIDTDTELEYWTNEGVLHYVIRQLL